MRFSLGDEEVIVCELCTPEEVEIPVKVRRTGGGRKTTIAEISFSGRLDWTLAHPLVEWYQRNGDSRKPWYSRFFARIARFFRS